MSATSFSEQRNRFLFPIICLFAIAITYFSNSLLFGGGAMEERLSLEYGAASVKQILKLGQKWLWVSYVLIPIIYFVKISYVCIALCCGIFLSNVSFRMSQVFRAVVVAEFVLLLPPILKILWFSFVAIDYTYDDLTYFFPLSMASLIERGTIDNIFVYPLQILNCFEIVYILVLANELRPLFDDSFVKSLSVTAISYGAAILLWVSIILFFSINFN